MWYYFIVILGTNDCLNYGHQYIKFLGDMLMNKLFEIVLLIFGLGVFVLFRLESSGQKQAIT